MVDFLETLNDLLWSHINFLIIVGVGLFFSFKSKFFQLRVFPYSLKIFRQMLGKQSASQEGVHPLKVFSAAIGGCIGIGNVVGVCTAIQIGGPGALFWVWVAGFLGMLLKYSEIYLGMKTRVNRHGSGFDGGPMYFLPKAFKVKWVATLFCLLMGIYGVEIYMFGVISDSISYNWHVPKHLCVAFFLLMILLAAKGGIKRVSAICSKIMPAFLIIYALMATWVIVQNITLIPSLIASIFKSAFTATSAIGAFAGSSIALTISMGMSRGCYSGDIGIGYSSVIHAESSETQAQKQAALGVLGIFLDTFIVCTLSILLVLLTGTWKQPISSLFLVQEALGTYFPLMSIFMPLFIFLLGYSTIIAFFTVGIKCSKFIHPKRGPLLYYLYGMMAFPLFAYIEPKEALTIMSLCGGMLLILNITAIFLLRKEIAFVIETDPKALFTKENPSREFS